MVSEELEIVDDNRCLARDCRCLYTINGHLCQRCYWQRHGHVHAGWNAVVPAVMPAPEAMPPVHAGWYDRSIVDECEPLLALQKDSDASRRAKEGN